MKPLAALVLGLSLGMGSQALAGNLPEDKLTTDKFVGNVISKERSSFKTFRGLSPPNHLTFDFEYEVLSLWNDSAEEGPAGIGIVFPYQTVIPKGRIIMLSQFSCVKYEDSIPFVHITDYFSPNAWPLQEGKIYSDRPNTYLCEIE